MTVSTTRRRLGIIGTTAVAAGMLAIGAPTTAQAHNYLVSSTPEAGQVLTSLPEEFVITTNDALLNLGGDAGGFALQVLDSDGLYYGDGCVTVDGPSMTATAALGAPGDYTILWQIVSIDGHTVSDQLTFTWQPDDISESSTGSTTPPVCGETSGAGDETPEASDAPGPSDEPATDAAAPDAPNEGIPTDLLWIGGAIVAVAIAAGATMLTLGRRKD